MYESNQMSTYMRMRADVYGRLQPENLQRSMVSEENYLHRHSCYSCEEFGIHIVPGDICFIDFGQAYRFEMGYQHFGLVIAVCQRKALVIPMTSNPATYANAYDPEKNPEGKRNLFDLGDIEHLNKQSVLFLNDMKFINTARILDVTAHLDVKSAKFRKIQMAVMTMIFQAR